MKLYNYYRLVFVDLNSEGMETIITGEQMKLRLIEMGLSVPALEKLVKIKIPSADLDGDGGVSNEEMRLWQIQTQPARDENARRLQAYLDQFTDYGQELQSLGFQFARLAKMDKPLTNGSPDFRYVIGVAINYGYTQAAEVLIGKYKKGKITVLKVDGWVTVNPINFIAFERFG